MKAFNAARYPNSFSGRMWVGARPNAETARCAVKVLLEAGEQQDTTVEGWTPLMPLMMLHKHMDGGRHETRDGARFIEEAVGVGQNLFGKFWELSKIRLATSFGAYQNLIGKFLESK